MNIRGKSISFFVLIFQLVLLRFHKKRLIIFDIDNTIANTWPALSRSESTFQIYRNLEVLTNTKKLALILHNFGFQIIFLSARNSRSYFITKKWLKLNGLPSNYLFLVSEPIKKLDYLNFWIRKNCIIHFFDDMSYNHENGKVLFYEDLINEVCSLPINYYGYSTIMELIEDENSIENYVKKIVC